MSEVTYSIKSMRVNILERISKSTTNFFVSNSISGMKSHKIATTSYPKKLKENTYIYVEGKRENSGVVHEKIIFCSE